MGLKRPGFKPNVKASLATTTSDKVFFDVKPDTTLRIRVLPPAREDGSIWTVAVNHFRLKNEEGRGVALACKKEHGDDGVCWLCDLSRVLKRHGDKDEQEIGDTIRPSPRWYVQALIGEKNEEGKWEYFGPKLVGLPKTAAEEVNSILGTQDAADDDYFCDVEKGQDLLITRTGSGYATRYKVMASGQKANLDKVHPGWEKAFISDVYDRLGLNLWEADDVKAAAHRAFGDKLDWENLSKEFKL